MNVPTIKLDYVAASAKFQEYRNAVKVHQKQEDVELMRGFRALKDGKTLIDVHDAMKFAGLNERNQPKLAICRADATHCYFRGRAEGWGVFAMDQNSDHRASTRRIGFPNRTFPKEVENMYRTSKAIVPSIPPRLRPNIAYSNLHILWEAEWETVPTDPLLLRRIGGFIFVVLAAWDLTDLEKAILKRHL